MILKNMNNSIFLCLSLCTLLTFGAAQEEACSQPSTELVWGACSRKGRRSNMEDAHVAILNFAENPDQSFFGVYDGHGGKFVAEAVAFGRKNINPLHVTLATCTEGSTAERLKKAFEITEKSILAGKDESGTTAVTALFENSTKTITIAWVDDSRAVIVQGGSIIATTDHKPNAPLEKERIKDAGGRIEYLGRNRTPYIGGRLAVSRALGDKDNKCGWEVVKGLTAKPEIGQIELTGENAFAIFACDGIWDVLSNEHAAKIVAKALNSTSTEVTEALATLTSHSQKKEGNNDAAIVAALLLCETAYALNSGDNLSAIVVQINKTQEPFAINFTSEEALKAIIGTVPSDDEYPEDELAREIEKLGW